VHFWIVLLTVFVVPCSFAQNQHSLELEIGGVGGFGSISYRNTFKESNKFSYSYRAGLSYVPIDANNGFGIVIPVLVHASYGSQRHQVDFGVGQGFTVTSKGQFFVRMPASLGYQFHGSKNMYYRIGYTPLISYIYNFQWEHWAGIAIGFKLRRHED